MVFWHDFISGLIAGSSSYFVGYPLDTIKVRLQNRGVTGSKSYGGILDCVLNTFKNESIFGFFKGMAFPLILAGSTGSLFYGIYGNCMYILGYDKIHQHHLAKDIRHTAFSGAMAGLGILPILCPVELVKVRLQMQTHLRGSDASVYKGPFHCVERIFMKEGIRGLFRGMTPLILGMGIGNGLFFTSYEHITHAMTSRLAVSCQGHDPSEEPHRAPLPVLILAGGSAGIFFWTYTTPFDVIKARMQFDGVYDNEYRNFRDCVRKSVRAEGWQVLWRGLAINCLRGFPVNAVSITIYNYISRHLKTI